MKMYAVIGIFSIIGVSAAIIGLYADVPSIDTIFQNQRSSILERSINTETFDIDLAISTQDCDKILGLAAEGFKDANEKQQIQLNAILDEC